MHVANSHNMRHYLSLPMKKRPRLLCRASCLVRLGMPLHGHLQGSVRCTGTYVGSECVGKRVRARNYYRWLAYLFFELTTSLLSCSCVLATINARRTLSLYVNKNDARNTPWTCAFDVQDAPYAKDRSGHAKTMAMQFTCIDWLSSTAEGAWLLAGTRGGDLVLFHANDGARLTYVTYLS